MTGMPKNGHLFRLPLKRSNDRPMGAKTIEVKASHLSLISHPDEITQLILGLRASVNS